MSFLQNVKFSNLKFITGIFFVLFILSACAGSDDSSQAGNVASGFLVSKIDEQEPTNLADYESTEYTQSAVLGIVKAAYAYGNIEALITADKARTGLTTSGIKQGGDGQIVSLIIQSSSGKSLFSANHQEFTESGTKGAAFDSINILTTDFDRNTLKQTSYTSDAHINAFSNCSVSCTGNLQAALIAARKGDSAQEMHGIAYAAKIKGILSYNRGAYADSVQQIVNSLSLGVGANIVAMNYSLQPDTVDICYNDKGVDKYYTRPVGHYQEGATLWDSSSNSCGKTPVATKLSTTELNAWRAAVNPDSTNKTIMVFSTGDNGMNSETGLIGDGEEALDTLTVRGSVEAANIPNFRAAYPVLYNERDPRLNSTDLTTGRWLAVTAVDRNNTILATANGCGIAMHFCLAAPGENIYTAAADSTSNGYANVTGTQYASATVAGALAVLKGAFPQATPEQLAQLVLDTATYIGLNGRNPDGSFSRYRIRLRTFTEEILYRQQTLRADGSARYINSVYGYGLLNLAAATTPSVTTSYVTASNNESIGVLWQDTSLTLSEAFGDNFESVTFGIGDVYGRHFTTNAPQVSHTPVAVGLDDYMAGLLGDNVQSERLGPQAQANYSNSEQSWMNLEYKAGKATSKIAFQESYKLKPLNDNSASAILRANHIRPASENIGMMDVDYEIGANLSLSSYAARGEYDTGHRFDELGTDFDVRYKKSNLNIGLGNLREHQQFLGTNSSGAYALKAPTVSRFTDVTYGHDVGNRFNIYANYIQYKTDVNMGYQDFATIDNLQADQYQVGIKGRNLLSDDDNLNIALITKLGVTDGALNQNTVLGYTADGGYNNVSQSYDLAVSERHQQFEITYQGRLYQNADKISALKNNRFFTTIRVDRNLNNVQGAGQTEIIGGINARF